MTRDEAIAEIASELGIGIDTLTTAIEDVGAGVDANAEAIEATRTAILEEVAKNEAAGMERDDALSAAIDTVASNLDTTRQEILDQLGTTEENLANDIADVKSDVQIVADYVGKPASEVTDADIDFVADLIAQQEVLADPTSFVPTDAQVQYDVNNDGVIDINDQNMLTESFGGQEVDLYGNKFNATGLYAYNDAIAAQQKREADARFEAEQQLEADRQLEMQTQANYNKEQGKVQDLFKDIASSSDLAGGTATTTPGPLTNIDYLYDIGGDSIFANPRQEELFATPYGESNSRRPVQDRRLAAAQGGLLKRNNELLRLLGED